MSIRRAPTILVVDDDVESRAAMVKVLDSVGYKTLEADNGRSGLDTILEGGIDVLVTDLRLPVMDGVELLKQAKAADHELEVILITGHGSVEVAVEAIKEGAYDFITKPVKKAQLLHAVERASEKQYLSRENKELRSQLNQGSSRKFVYSSPEMQAKAKMVEQVASSTATVLITGDSGTGKEIVADAIHSASPRRGKPLIKVSCAALPETLLELSLIHIS